MSVDEETVKKRQNKNSQKFYSLSPEENAQDIEEYEEALSWALKYETIKNIAVTGGYGSGKSSFLKTFKNKHDKYNYLEISLARFNEKKYKEVEEVEKGEAGEELVKEKHPPTQLQLIERSILQQLFYFEDSKNLPNTRFKKIENTGKPTYVFRVLFTLMFLLSLVRIFTPRQLIEIKLINELVSEIFLRTGQGWIISLSIRYLAIICILAFIGWVLYILYTNFSRATLKFSHSVGSIEFDNSTKESSILNKYIEEILYFFEATNYNVVIIEDLDRFKNTEIFTKLRELNQLLNKSKGIKRKIVFIYAMNDDFFYDSNERVKFFDFVIPILHKVNPFTSMKHLEKYLDKVGSELYIHDLSSSISRALLREALYIPDLRMIKNISNEFVIFLSKYRKIKLNLESVDYERILALVMYKNLYPKDFKDLLSKKGVIFTQINKKDEYVSTLTQNKRIKIEEYSEEKKIIKKEARDSVEEIRMKYILAASRIYSSNNFSTHRGIYEFDQYIVPALDLAKDQSKFELLRKNKLYHSKSNNEVVDFEKVSKEFEGSYDDLVKDGKNNLEQLLKDKDNQIEILNKEISLLQKKALSELIIEGAIELEFKHTVDKNQEKIITSLLKEGFVDENYFSYISIFVEGKVPDLGLLSSIHLDQPKEWDYRVEGVEVLRSTFEYLEKKDFYKNSILNFDLLLFLIDNKDEYQDFYNSFIEFFTKNFEENIKFLSSFYKYSEKVRPEVFNYIEEFTITVLLKNKEFLRILKDNVSEPEFNWIIDVLLIVGEVNDLKKIFEDHKDILEEKEQFLESQTDKIISLKKKLDLKFKNLLSENSKKLWRSIINGKNFEINSQMIERILIFHEVDISTFEQSNYELIINSNIKPLIETVQDNFELYIDRVHVNFSDKQSLSEEVVLSILRLENVTNSTKVSFLSNVNTKIQNIEFVESKGIIEVLLDQNIIIPDWQNIIHSFKILDLKFVESLTNYLNRSENYQILGSKRITTDLADEEVLSSFVAELFKDNKLKVEPYKKFILKTPWRYNSLAFEGLDENKVKLLIENKKLTFTQSNLDKVKEYYPDLTSIFFKTYKRAEYLKEIWEGVIRIDESDLQIILKNSTPKSNKKQLVNHQYSLLEEGEEFDLSTLNIINQELKDLHLIENINLLKDLILRPVESNANKIERFNKYFEEYEDDEVFIREFLRKIGGKYLIIANKTKGSVQFNTKNKEWNEELVNHLVKAGIIQRIGKGKSRPSFRIS